MVKNGPLDGEGNLLHRLKDINPEVPIAVSLDLHANVTDLMVNNCDVIAGYKTYPHIDMFETGFLADPNPNSELTLTFIVHELASLAPE